jgi:hypothetical protein
MKRGEACPLAAICRISGVLKTSGQVSRSHLPPTYKFSFKETIVTGVLDSGSLRVETFNHFTDGSGRSDYYTRRYFCKARGH